MCVCVCVCVCVSEMVFSVHSPSIQTTTAYAELVLQPISGLFSGILPGLLPSVGLFVSISPGTAQNFVQGRLQASHPFLSALPLLLDANPYLRIDIDLQSCDNCGRRILFVRDSR